MSECQFIVVFIVEYIDKVSVEGMDFLNLRERIEDVSEPIVYGLLTKFNLHSSLKYLPHVECPNARDIVARMHDSRSLSLCLRQNDVDEIFCRGYGLNRLEVVVHLQC